LFKIKIGWSVPVAEVAAVDWSSDPFHGYISSKFEIKATSKNRNFTFGFAKRGSQEDAISRGNLEVAVEAVQGALSARTSD
jgi:hypothetical protein